MKEMTSLQREIHNVKARMVEPGPDPRVAEKQRTKRLHEMAKKPKIKIEGLGCESQCAEGSGDT